MGRVLSIDLAYRRSQDFGVCLIEEQGGRPTRVRFIPPEELIAYPPEPQRCARAISDFCQKHGIKVVLLDGPQGWKDPASALKFRHCEKILNTQAKTATEGQVLPGNFTDFVKFSVLLFTHLTAHGGVLVEQPTIRVPEKGFVLAESFPRSAWGKLGIKSLPGKKKATQEDLKVRLHTLEERFGFKASSDPTHDELCALVAGLAGVAILAGNINGYFAEGSPPRNVRGVTVEGFIVNPWLKQKPA